MKSLGWKVVYNDQYPPTGPTSWAPYVQSMKDKGVKGLIWVGEPENLAKFEQALVDANYPLDWIRTDANHYDSKLIDVGGAAIKNTYIRSVFYPFEDASKNPATQQYLDAFEQYLPERQGEGVPRPPGLVGLARCGRRPRRSAAPTSPASACTTTCRRSPTGPAAGCTRRRTPATTCPATASR